ncbi:hypothetical protein G9A89_004966 [Geosiphon pyriformis]|nr:hypothetical protein G9A89_004966 [Geosiphon pyriformis]
MSSSQQTSPKFSATRKILSIDQNFVNQIEGAAYGVAKDLNGMLSNLQGQMFQASKLTRSSFDIYDLTITNYCSTIQEAANKTKKLIILCESLDQEFSMVHKLAAQIKDIKQQVDVLQNVIR